MWARASAARSGRPAASVVGEGVEQQGVVGQRRQEEVVEQADPRVVAQRRVAGEEPVERAGLDAADGHRLGCGRRRGRVGVGDAEVDGGARRAEGFGAEREAQPHRAGVQQPHRDGAAPGGGEGRCDVGELGGARRVGVEVDLDVVAVGRRGAGLDVDLDGIAGGDGLGEVELVVLGGRHPVDAGGGGLGEVAVGGEPVDGGAPGGVDVGGSPGGEEPGVVVLHEEPESGPVGRGPVGPAGVEGAGVVAADERPEADGDADALVGVLDVADDGEADGDEVLVGRVGEHDDAALADGHPDAGGDPAAGVGDVDELTLGRGEDGQVLLLVLPYPAALQEEEHADSMGVRVGRRRRRLRPERPPLPPSPWRCRR